MMILQKSINQKGDYIEKKDNIKLRRNTYAYFLGCWYSVIRFGCF